MVQRTPALDRRADGVGGMKILASTLLIVCLIAVHGSLASRFNGDGWLVGRLLIVAGFGFIVTLVHELGHAAAVLAVRGRVTRIVVLPFAYHIARRRLERAGPMRNRELGGYVAYQIDAIDARRKHAIVAAAGPFANGVLALLLVGIAAAFWVPAIPGSVDGVLPGDSALEAWRTQTAFARTAQPLLHALAALSLGVGLSNLIPFSGSDGQVILRALWRKRSSAER